ncbi:MAG: MMPL family transporter [Candidatus Nanopelagicales bacterium]|nr:MMPL family transporter [Candidatus Nanopelagicales bacterium]
MGPVSRWAVNHPKLGLLAWFVGVLAVGGLASGLGGSYNNSFSLPDTESSRAQQLLEQIPGAKDSFGAATAKVAWKSESGGVTSPAVAGAVTGTLTKISQVPGVSCVIGPYGPPLGSECPKSTNGQAPAQNAGNAEMSPTAAKAMAGLAPAGMSVDQKIGYATVTFRGTSSDVPAADALAVIDDVTELNAQPDITAGAGGYALEAAEHEPPSSEGIGVTVALIILLFTFGSLVGAFLPVISAVLSLAAGQGLVLITARFLDVATFAPTLAAMIGLGVGIDYSLFVINRYKQALDVGREPRAAALESVRTAGRAVVFAAITVIIALLGLFVLRIDFFQGLAVAAAATVIMMMIGATLLLPAVLSLLGRRAFAIRMPWARKSRQGGGGRGFARYGQWLERRYRVFGALAVIVLVVIALPAASLRLGFTDDGNKAEGKSARVAYDLLAEGFGPGINGPFVIAVETTQPGDNAAVAQLAGAVRTDPGVAAVVAMPLSPDSNVTAIQIVPTSAPQDEATMELLDRLREQVIVENTSSGSAQAFVGGTQAITSDFTKMMATALPVFLVVVIGLGFLALVVLFRSLLVPLTGAITSLLSLSAAMGLTVAVFQWGWLADVVGLTSTGPIMPFLPVMVFAILFGLSMDYQVFLVSRMQEEWGHTKDNRQAVRRGLAASGRVVAIAAAIMFSVFAAFILGADPTIKLFGLALATAVLFDAFIVRLVVVPSIMYAFGSANWWFPAWLEKLLPRVAVESDEDVAFEEAEIEDVPDEDIRV